MEFMGIYNVIDVEPILGADGCADGFIVKYKDDRSYVNRAGKWINKVVECRKTVWVREYDYNSKKSDGEIHGFGKGSVYTKRVKKEKKGMTTTGLACVTKILGKK